MSRNPPRGAFAPVTRTPAGWFKAGAIERAWTRRGGTLRVADGYAVRAGGILAVTKAEIEAEFGRVYRPDGSRVAIKGGDAGAYKVRPGAIRAVSPEFRKWLQAWDRRIAASDARMVKRTPTLAQLSPVVRERAKRLGEWANAVDWRAIKARAA